MVHDPILPFSGFTLAVASNFRMRVSSAAVSRHHRIRSHLVHNSSLELSVYEGFMSLDPNYVERRASNHPHPAYNWAFSLLYKKKLSDLEGGEDNPTKLLLASQSGDDAHVSLNEVLNTKWRRPMSEGG
jgi:hypothetical protein